MRQTRTRVLDRRWLWRAKSHFALFVRHATEVYD